MEFRRELKYPPASRIALLILRGRNEDKVSFSAEHFRRELQKELAPIGDLILAGPAPAPLARAESHYLYQIMLRTQQMTRLSRHLAQLTTRFKLPDEVSLTIDIDPTNLA